MALVAKEAAARIAVKATEERIRFPLTWTENQIRQAIGAALMMNRLDDGTFDDKAVLTALIEKFGQLEDPKKSKKRDSTAADLDDDDSDAADEPEGEEGEEEPDEEGEGKSKKRKKRTPKEKKPKIKKTEIMENEANRGIAVAIKEIGDIHFQNKDMKKGFVFAKAAKALRECPTAVTTKKEAMALPGIGAGRTRS
jgi:hypothetical protein